MVLDPFCGKGTSLLAARLLGHAAYGLDIAPEAVVCAEAKLQSVDLSEVERYISYLPSHLTSISEVPDSVRLFFHPDTLLQLLSVRQSLLTDVLGRASRRRSCAVFVLATLLGILHGHASYSLSVPSSHAYSMSPGYVARYMAERGLQAPARDVKDCLRTKARRCLADPAPPAATGAVKRASAVDADSVFRQLRGKVDVVLTSPPYLAAQTYAKDNWLRLWLLGYDHRDIRSDYLQTDCLDRYMRLMASVFRTMSTMLRPGGKLICVAGDVMRKRRRNGEELVETVETGNLLASICSQGDVGLTLVETAVQHVPSKRRYFSSLSNTNGHTARDLVERVFVARK